MGASTKRRRGREAVGKFEVVKEDTPSIRWAGAAKWEVLPLRKPVGEELSSFVGELEPMEMASEEWEDAWWSKQLEEVQQRGLQPDGEADPDFGGILEGAEHKPEDEALRRQPATRSAYFKVLNCSSLVV